MRPISLLPVNGLLAAMLLGCPPPPEIEVGDTTGGVPGIELLYPPQDTTVIPLTPEGTLKFVAVVDLEGFSFSAPGAATAPVEGQGHWHLFVEPLDFYVPPQGMYYEAEIQGADPEGDGTHLPIQPGFYNIIVQLQNNDHTEYASTFDCDPCEDALEFEVVAADDTDG